MTENADILNILPDKNIFDLRSVYLKNWPYGSYVYNFLTVCKEWKEKKSCANYFTLMVPENWREEGTFICLMQFGCYDIIMFTLEEDCKCLYQALTNTKRIDWSQEVLIFAVHDNHVPVVEKIMNHINFQVKMKIRSQAWRISINEALSFDTSCPPEVYLGILNESHVPKINAVWPHKYPNSENYLRTMIETNYGFGLFLKCNNELIAWVVKNHLGLIAILQVDDNHCRKGYGNLLTKIMAKKLAEEGLEPFGFLVKSNSRSNALFAKLGFSILNGLSFYKNSSL